MLRKILIILFLPLLLLCSFAHPFYLSVTNLKYNGDKNTIEGTARLFTSDLEDALSRLSGRKVDLLNTPNRKAADKLIESYLQSRFSLQVNGAKLPLTYLGFENEEEATWLYFEAGKAAKPARVSVTNTILYDFLPEQMNIVHVSVGENRISRKLSPPEKTLIIDFGP